MTLSKQTIEAIALEFLEGEFCQNKTEIQKFITAYINSVKTNESFIDKEIHLVAGQLLQDAFNAVSTLVNCSS